MVPLTSSMWSDQVHSDTTMAAVPCAGAGARRRQISGCLETRRASTKSRSATVRNTSQAPTSDWLRLPDTIAGNSVARGNANRGRARFTFRSEATRRAPRATRSTSFVDGSQRLSGGVSQSGGWSALGVHDRIVPPTPRMMIAAELASMRRECPPFTQRALRRPPGPKRSGPLPEMPACSRPEWTQGTPRPVHGPPRSRGARPVDATCCSRKEWHGTDH